MSIQKGQQIALNNRFPMSFSNFFAFHFYFNKILFVFSFLILLSCLSLSLYWMNGNKIVILQVILYLKGSWVNFRIHISNCCTARIKDIIDFQSKMKYILINILPNNNITFINTGEGIHLSALDIVK